LRVIGDEHAFDLNGPTACELMDHSGLAAIQARLGPDPLRSDADPDQVWHRISRSRSAIGKLLLDQSIIAGVGNVYRAEVLFILQIHPDRPGSSLSLAEFETLWATLVELMKIGVKYNRIITADPATIGRSRGRMRREDRLLVYKKPHCRECDSPVDSWDLGGRTIYACTRCQT
jgi:endonuclease-8